MNISFPQLTTTQLLSEPVTELLLKQHNLVLVGATSSFEMAQKKKLPYLLQPQYVVPDLASLMEGDYSSWSTSLASRKWSTNLARTPSVQLGSRKQNFRQNSGRTVSKLWVI